jgi:hypothetical protein
MDSSAFYRQEHANSSYSIYCIMCDILGMSLLGLIRWWKIILDDFINVLIRNGMEVGLEVNAGQNNNMKITNRSFQNVEQFKYLWTTVTDKNLIR